MRPKKPLIAAELSRLREKPPRATSREPLSQSDRLAILNELRDGEDSEESLPFLPSWACVP